jgi:hypothetical protein
VSDLQMIADNGAGAKSGGVADVDDPLQSFCVLTHLAAVREALP